jgi:2-iminobutanoate/2-iminopropanoate deaminase
VLDDTRVCAHSDDSSVGVLQILSSHLEDKPSCAEIALEPRSDKLTGLLPEPWTPSSPHPGDDASVWARGLLIPHAHVQCGGLGQTSITSAGAMRAQQGDPKVMVVEQFRWTMEAVQIALERKGSQLGDVVFVNLFLKHMEHFTAVNKEYCEWFGEHPPSRSCVTAAFSEPCLVALHVTFLRGSMRAMQDGMKNVRQVCLFTCSNNAQRNRLRYCMCKAYLSGLLCALDRTLKQMCFAGALYSLQVSGRSAVGRSWQPGAMPRSDRPASCYNAPRWLHCR